MYLKVWSSALLLAASYSSAWAQTLSHTLDNGLKIIVREDQRAPVVVTQLWYKVGSVDEETGKTGLSHVLEHMMFKGTPNIPSGEYAKRISALGGSLNAYTNRDETVYYQTIASQHLPEVLKMEADRMVNLSFSNADYVNELEVVKEERRLRTDDSPSGRLFETLYETAFVTSGNRSPIIGSMSDLGKMTGDDAKAWYRKWYAPNHATLVIVGDVDAKKTIQNVQQTFGDIHANTFTPPTLPQEPIQTQTRHAQTSAPSEVPMVALAYQVPHLKTLDERLPYALDTLANVLDGNAASRLEKNLVRGQPIALSVGANYSLLSRSDELFILSGAPAQNIDVTTLINALKQEIKKIATDGVDEAELTRIRTQREASEIYAKDAITAQASLLGNLESKGFSYQDEDAIRQKLNSVTAQEVQQAAQYLTDDKLTQVILQPESLSSKGAAQ
ncbi:peptidase M16 [Vitreoscilla sp. C1]|uniref:M16 family metallopeptidase n=1 Tax=Vitreoscilla sp. (strain C1) TaxID=96942 RepID=UPI000CDC625A|nr:pitrilysin family protein [Vitreoscilla sp. C1]AUZ06186.1 peptidase M16 [Vitreoscilla sp. C1]